MVDFWQAKEIDNENENNSITFQLPLNNQKEELWNIKT